VTRYGLNWPGNNALAVEIKLIQNGGYLTIQGIRYGEGLFFHYKAMQSLLWPEDDHHRWSDLILREIIANRITVIMGSRDSSKTRTVSKWALCDYYCFPDETLTLMTSTNLRGLELRVWGDIKSLHERARDRYPALHGNVADSKHGVFTDNISDGDEVRDMRKGILCIPVLGSQGEFMGDALKDFCFPSGTLVNTPWGLRPIELIGPGDKVLSAIGYRRVAATSIRLASELVKVRLRDGRQMTCTPNHEVLTQKGWEKACELNETHYILGPYETMSSMRYSNQQQSRLLSKVLVLNDGHSRGSGDDLYCRTPPQGEREGASSNAYRQSDEGQGLQQQGERGIEVFGPQSQDSRGQWDWTHQSRVATDEDVSRGSMELWHQNRKAEWERLSVLLQSGFGVSRHQICPGGRWIESRQLGQSEIQGSEEGRISTGSWVDRVETIKQTDSRFPRATSNSGRCAVYNLEVEGHPSYCVNGLVVHNCGIKQKRRRLIGDELQHVPTAYLKVLDSFDKGDFKAGFLGNPIADNGKALDRVAEPVDGWDSVADLTKTKTWPNKYNGLTINLVGIDSPNFDPETRNRYPYLVDQGDVDRVSRRPGGKDSIEWWSQIMGVRKAGAVSNRVLTVAEIERYDGFKDCVWSGSGDRVKVYSIDAGFGGDECVRTWLEFGEVVGGRKVISFKDQKVIPIRLSVGDSPEKQIARYAKEDCALLGIPAAHVFFEAGMYATLAVEMARELGTEVNAVNFGGPATERPVSSEWLVFDQRTEQRRLKTWYEHVSKFVTELWFVVRLLAQCRQARNFPRQAAEEFGRRQWNYVSNDRYELEPKDDYKLRYQGESPNHADSLVVGVEGARRLGFAIEAIPEDGREREAPDDYLKKELEAYQRERKKRSLSYSR